MKTKTIACFFPAGKSKVCTSDFSVILHKTFGAGAQGPRRRRKRRKR